MKEEKDQVSLHKLVFTHNWEDPESDHAALRIQPNDHVMAISSGGCNVLGFLLDDPAVIYSVDINPAQSWVLQLKIAAMKRLDYDEFICFAGLKPCNDRLALYDKIKGCLSGEALSFWDHKKKIIAKGFIMQGKYERFILLAGKFIHFLQGKGRVRNLFIDKTKEAQERYFDEVWDTRRFHYLFSLLFNKRMLARRGLVADYFHFDDGSRSFAESFYNRSRKAFRDIPIKGNYFLHLYLQGKYRNAEEVPAYLKKENFHIIKERLDRIRIITSGAQDWIDSAADNSISCFALSNICELMSEQDTLRLFTGVQRTARPGARVIFRNLMIPREVPEELRTVIVKDEELSRQLYNTDRSFVYGKVAAYSINK